MAAQIFTYTNASLKEWQEEVLKRYPSATFTKAPEEEGGTRTAFTGDSFVGDWDGSEAPYGRILDR